MSGYEILESIHTSYVKSLFLQDIFDVTNMDLTAVSKSFGFSVPPFVDLPISNKPKV